MQSSKWLRLMDLITSLTGTCSYFDRDVECVCSFFKKRFRFQGSQTPRFRDVVSEDRQQMRESRAKRRAKKAREVQDGEYMPSPEDEPLGLELDALADASGVSSSKKQTTPLEQVSEVGFITIRESSLRLTCSTWPHFGCSKKLS